MVQSSKELQTGALAPASVARLEAARSGDREAFARLTEPYRYELQVHCYRMLGSLLDAEDAVQETLLKAWRRLDTYRGRASLRAWLYKIATNSCLDALKARRRRTLPEELYPESPSGAAALPAIAGPVWIEPFPDACLAQPGQDPEARYDAREAITLAFTAALQTLPPRQRAVLILRDVLGWGAQEVAELLQASRSAVHSALYRARATMQRSHHGEDRSVSSPTPPEPDQEQLLDRYVRAWQAADVERLVSLLKHDATFSMPPLPTWCRGRVAIRDFVRRHVLDGQAAGRWTLLRTQASGRPAFGWYRREEGQPSSIAFAIQVLEIEDGLVAHITTFGFPVLFPFFGLPVVLPDSEGGGIGLR